MADDPLTTSYAAVFFAGGQMMFFAFSVIIFYTIKDCIDRQRQELSDIWKTSSVIGIRYSIL